MGNQRLTLRKTRDIFYLELCAPPGNVTDRLFFQELAEIIPELEKCAAVHGCIIFGQGRHFSSGADIDELKLHIKKPDNHTVIESLEHSASLFSRLANLPFPVVAAINGCCMGSGLELALACHCRIAAKNALFSLPETTFSLMPGCGGTVRLPKLIGVASAIEMILSAEPVLAEEAFKTGLIDSIVPKKELLAKAEQLVNILQTSGYNV